MRGVEGANAENMRKKHLAYLRCPQCRAELRLMMQEGDGQRVRTGSLLCDACPAEYPIREFIPRLVCSEANYTSDFGFEWNKHYRTQYDSETGVSVSEERFFKETGWPRDLKGQLLLEAGSGSGRFTEHAASTGAMVISVDFSSAVDANYKSNGEKENVLIVQADILCLPFPGALFDKVLCIGVLQHTPVPEKAFLALAAMLKKRGHLVVDAYERLPGWKGYFETKYWVRPLTKRLPHKMLYALCERWVNFMWPVCKLSYRLTGRRTLSWFLLIADYRGVYPLSEEILKQWSILDSFDMLAPEYDFPQTIQSVTGWFKKAGLVDVEVRKGYNGIQGSGFKP